MSYEEQEFLNSLTRLCAAKRLRTAKATNVACWGIPVLLAFLLGLAM